MINNNRLGGFNPIIWVVTGGHITGDQVKIKTKTQKITYRSIKIKLIDILKPEEQLRIRRTSLHLNYLHNSA